MVMAELPQRSVSRRHAGLKRLPLSRHSVE
jgi:hypothetical protein